MTYSSAGALGSNYITFILNYVALESSQSELFDAKSKLDEENEARLVLDFCPQIPHHNTTGDQFGTSLSM